MAMFTQIQKLIMLLAFLLTLMQSIGKTKAEKPEDRGYDMEDTEGQFPEKGSRKINRRLQHVEEWDPEVFGEADLEHFDGLSMTDLSFDEKEDFDVRATDDDNEKMRRQKRSSSSLPRWFRMYCLKSVCRKRYNCNSFIYPKGRSYCRICKYSMCRGSGTNPLMARSLESKTSIRKV